MLVAVAKMRWIAALLVVSIMLMLCGCHASGVLAVANVLGLWYTTDAATLEAAATGGTLVFLAINITFTGAVCTFVGDIDTDGNGTPDQQVELQGAWQQNGENVTATLTLADASSATLGAPQAELDLALAGINLLQGSLAYTLGGLTYIGQLSLHRCS